MIYCDAAAVKRYVNTAMSDSDIAMVIEDSDAFIDKKIGPQDVNDKVVRRLSALISARAIKAKDPQATVVGDFRVQQNPLEWFDGQINEIFELYSNRVVIVG